MFRNKLLKTKLYYLRDRKGKSARISEKIKKRICIDVSEQVSENQNVEEKLQSENKKEVTLKPELKEKELKKEKK